MNTVLKINPGAKHNDPTWNKTVALISILIQDGRHGIGNIQAAIIEALEDIQAERIESEGDDYYETAHCHNMDHLVELTGMFNDAFDMIPETDNKEIRVEKIDQLISSLESYRNRLEPVKNHTLQSTINVIRTWVFSRNGQPFGINDIYAGQDISSRLPANIKTMLLIEKALFALGCSVNSNSPDVRFNDKIFTPPVRRQVIREVLL